MKSILIPFRKIMKLIWLCRVLLAARMISKACEILVS